MEAEHHLAVEDAIRQEIGNKKNVDGKYKYMLQEISVKFVEKLPLFPPEVVISTRVSNILVSTLYITLVQNPSIKGWSVRQKTNQSTWECQE